MAKVELIFKEEEGVPSKAEVGVPSKAEVGAHINTLTSPRYNVFVVINLAIIKLNVLLNLLVLGF